MAVTHDRNEMAECTGDGIGDARFLAGASADPDDTFARHRGTQMGFADGGEAFVGPLVAEPEFASALGAADDRDARDY